MPDSGTQIPGGVNMPIPPVEPGGTRTLLSAKLANSIIQMANLLKKIRADQTSGLKIQLSDDNILIDASRIAAGGSGSGTSMLLTMQTEFDDYISCMDGEENLYNVAKPYLLQRQTYTAAPLVLFDGTHTYGYLGVNTRTDTITIDSVSTVFYQKIMQPYIAGQFIVADQPSGGTGCTAAPVYRDMNWDGRQWATEFPLCAVIGSTTLSGFQLVTGSDFYLTSIG